MSCLISILRFWSYNVFNLINENRTKQVGSLCLHQKLFNALLIIAKHAKSTTFSEEITKLAKSFQKLNVFLDTKGKLRVGLQQKTTNITNKITSPNFTWLSKV